MRGPAYPKSLTTIGEHIRKRRLDLGLLQREAAKRIGVTESTVYNWEKVMEPEVRFLPKIIEFLGYNPLPEARTLGEQIVRCRKMLGLSRKKMAKHLGVDEGTLAGWERDIRVPSSEKHFNFIERFLNSK